MTQNDKRMIKDAYNDFDKPAKETIAAMLEAEGISRDVSVKHYDDVEEALRELKR